MWTLRKTMEIDAAHFLPGHPGKCQNLHGHRWKVQIQIETNQLNDQGMVVDFGTLKSIVNKLDHKVINDLAPFNETPPTAENLARVIASQVRTLPNMPTAKLSVTVEESPGSSVTWVG